MRNCPQCGAECSPEHRFCPVCGFPIGALRTAAGDPLIGRTLGNAYVILEAVGSGGMGKVYRAEQASLGKTLAVKVIHPHLISDESATSRFYTEARACSRLNHPNSVSVLDFGKTDDGLLYLVMEFLRGKDLAHVLWEEGPLPAARAVGILRQTLAALSEAHDLGIIHRDIKPENILIEPLRTGGDFVKVVDFGLAKVRADVAPSVTMPGIVCGTPDYMAPEQGRGDPLDQRSDLYACGVLLFQITTGRLPFEADSPTQTVLMHMTTPPPDPREYMPTIPEPIARCILKSLKKDAADRYQSAVEFAESLDQALAESNASNPIRSLAPPQSCRQCGAEIVPGKKFCGECGAKVSISPSANALSSVGNQATAKSNNGANKTSRPGAPTEILQQPTENRTHSEPQHLPFMGRAAELTKLEHARARTVEGQLVAVRLVGDEGIGKFRLACSFSERAKAMGDRVIIVGPDPMLAGVAYAPIARCIEECLGLSPKEDPLAKLSTLGRIDHAVRTGFEEIFTENGAHHLEGRSRRAAVVAALKFALRYAAERAPSQLVLFIVSQLHRIDTASVAVLTALTATPVEVQALMIGTHTPRVDPRWLHSEAIALRPLDSTLVKQAIQTILGAETESVAELLDRLPAEILPLHADQLLRWILEGGGPAPSRMVDLIASRFERLGARERKAVQALGILGEASLETIGKVTGEEVDDLIEISLRMSGWVAPFSHNRKDVHITHPLLREVAESSIPAAAKAQLYNRCADALKDNRPPLEARAMLAHEGDVAFESLILLERVGDRALARSDDLGAAHALRQGLERARKELLRGEIDDPERPMAIFARKLGDALIRVGDVAEAEGVLREALELVPRTNIEWARLQGMLSKALYARGRGRDALKTLDEAIKVAKHLRTRTAAVELMITHAEMDSQLGATASAVVQLRSANELLTDALANASRSVQSSLSVANEDISLNKLRVDVLLRLAQALRAAGQDIAAIEPITEARSTAERLNLIMERARCDAESAEHSELIGDRHAAALAWKRAAKVAKDAGDLVSEGIYLERQSRLGVQFNAEL